MLMLRVQLFCPKRLNTMKPGGAIPNRPSALRPPGTEPAARKRTPPRLDKAISPRHGNADHADPCRDPLRPVSLPVVGHFGAQHDGQVKKRVSENVRADEAVFRLLLESMHEGAVVMTADGTILYANPCFARLVKCPLHEVMMGSVSRFLSAADQAVVAPLLKRRTRTDSKLLISLQTADGSHVPTHVWVRPMSGQSGRNRAIGMVVTDVTDFEPGEALLRSLTHRVVQAHEAERGQVALQLHERITQMLCGILFRCQSLAAQLPPNQGGAHDEAVRITRMLGEAAEEVERISHDLRPSVLDNLGLVAALGATHAEFVARTGSALKVSLMPLTDRLSPEADIALYRIHQEALKNIEQHARARHVSVELTQHGGTVQLTIRDDGTGFHDSPSGAARKTQGLGLLSMRERAAAVGGVLKVESVRAKGTLIQAQIPTLNHIKGPTS